MGNFFKSNDFRTDYKKRPNDEYKNLYNKLDDETKQKMSRQRSLILVGVVVLVFILIIVLAVTGIGTNKADSIENILGRTGTVKVALIGDRPVNTSGIKTEIEKKAECTIDVYPTIGKHSENTTYKQMSEKGDIVILQMLLENALADENCEGILEANIDGLANQGCLVYLVNYPYASTAENSAYAAYANGLITKAAKAKNILLLDAQYYFRNNPEYSEAELFEEDGLTLTETGSLVLGKFIAEGLLEAAGLN